jgi:homocysteine S-methyltransferase
MAATILDGGTGQELVKRAGETASPLWSVKVLAQRPRLVEEVHRDFLA